MGGFGVRVYRDFVASYAWGFILSRVAINDPIIIRRGNEMKPIRQVSSNYGPLF